MKRHIVVVFLAAAALVLIVPAGAQKNSEADTMLAAAQQKETLEGDPSSAIKQYSAIVAKYTKTDRAVTAMALVHMAECYQKMGDSQARKIYEQVVRDYGDQREAAALARAGLGNEPIGEHFKGDRPVWTGANVDMFGTVSPDGRLLTYVDWTQTGNLMLHDLATGTDRPLTNNVKSYGEFGYPGYSAISKDGKQVAYHWETRDNSPLQLRVASLQGTGIPVSHAIPFQNENASLVQPRDWSPDGNWLAVFLARKDRTGQIGLVGVHDGSWRPLKSTDWRGPAKIVFSPDGRYLAYDLPMDLIKNERHILVMSVDGSREIEAVAHPSQNYPMGWSPDGKHLLIASDRSGTMALWDLPFASGKPQAPPREIEDAIGAGAYSLGVTTSGTLYVYRNPPATHVQVLPIDLDAGELRAAPANSFQRFIYSRAIPEWSPNGKYLAYRSCSPSGDGPCALEIASMENGEVRDVQPMLAYMGDSIGVWSPDDSSFCTQGTDLKGRRGYYRIDVRTGETFPLAGAGSREILAPDGKKVYYQAANTITQRDVASGEELQLYRMSASSTELSWPSISPDNRSIVFSETDSKATRVLLMPTTGGTPRELLRVEQPAQIRVWGASWAPDAKAIIVPKFLTADYNHEELWVVPVDGGEPRKLNIETANWEGEEGFSLSPDGHHLAIVTSAGKPGAEVWALNNYLTRLTAKK